jgi:MazG family protein
VFQAALREREGAFDLDAVVSAIVTKLIRRHPHVFESRTGDAQTPQEVARLWEATKRAERGEAWQTQPLGDLPPDLPALLRAPRLQQRAAALGFDWPDIDGAIAKFHEEWDELEHARKAGSRAAMEEEFGDLLFVLVRVGQKLGIVADTALALANRKFETRFAHVVRRCMAEGLDPAGAGLDRLEAFWQDAKRLEKSAQSPESPERPE